MVDITQVGVFVVGVFVDAEGIVTNNADVAGAVVVEIAGERAERLDGAVDYVVLVHVVVGREAEGLTLLGAGNIGFQGGEVLSGSAGGEGLIFGRDVLVDGPKFVGNGSLIMLLRCQACAYRLGLEERVAEASRREDDIRRLVGSWNSRDRSPTTVGLKGPLKACGEVSHGIWHRSDGSTATPVRLNRVNEALGNPRENALMVQFDQVDKGLVVSEDRHFITFIEVQEELVRRVGAGVILELE